VGAAVTVGAAKGLDVGGKVVVLIILILILIIFFPMADLFFGSLGFFLSSIVFFMPSCLAPANSINVLGNPDHVGYHVVVGYKVDVGLIEGISSTCFLFG